MSDITQWIRNELYENSDEGSKDFHSSLVPGISNILGVRVPKLREIAKRAAKGGQYVQKRNRGIYRFPQAGDD